MGQLLTSKELFDKMLSENEEVTSTEMMIEFAKLHVEQALKLASKKAKIVDVGIDYAITEWVVDKDSILNSYPIENIK
jgi:hypothetical protein